MIQTHPQKKMQPPPLPSIQTKKMYPGIVNSAATNTHQENSGCNSLTKKKKQPHSISIWAIHYKSLP